MKKALLASLLLIATLVFTSCDPGTETPNDINVSADLSAEGEAQMPEVEAPPFKSSPVKVLDETDVDPESGTEVEVEQVIDQPAEEPEEPPIVEIPEDEIFPEESEPEPESEPTQEPQDTEEPVIYLMITAGITPADLLAQLPLIEGSVSSTVLQENNITLRLPLDQPAVQGSAMQYQTVRAEYSIALPAQEIMEWYDAILTGSGFTLQTKNGWGDGTATGSSWNWELTSQPQVDVDIHVYTIPGIESNVLELTVTRNITLSTPYNSSLIPADVTSINLSFEGVANINITGTQAIADITAMVNALPARPDYVVLGMLPGGDDENKTWFTLVFQSSSQGAITVTKKSVNYQKGIYIAGHPTLEDVGDSLEIELQALVTN